jgi:hypothetical protein
MSIRFIKIKSEFSQTEWNSVQTLEFDQVSSKFEFQVQMLR